MTHVCDNPECALHSIELSPSDSGRASVRVAVRRDRYYRTPPGAGAVASRESEWDTILVERAQYVNRKAKLVVLCECCHTAVQLVTGGGA